ncbi:two-component system sensor histidine kinase [Fulvivirga imtechensis AK7]|uniref:histidine kinase n=1 Tax=Fulvivirga imtechensis AK7 TaxID=1237149 RepID=L8JRU6_9BACT|nr:HAMP domain-containing sensor histidine kinase [Fulvivirga imtechensis]ELR70199.1 two-component system sensor histidine kinase [Fulvivirga imtechensis AK7]
MKIRKKITLIYVVLTGVLLLALFILIYLFSNTYTKSEFFDRLNGRAKIVAQIYLEKDELSSIIYDEVRKKHSQILPNEREAVFRVNLQESVILHDTLFSELPKSFLYKILKDKEGSLKIENTYYSGILYFDNQGDFIVISSADNIYGEAKMNNLAQVLIVSFLFTILSLYIIGRYYSGKVLEPITKITNSVNSITATNLHLRLPIENNKDELGELARTFNNMLDRLESTFDLQKTFINNASHELKNPLAVILGEAEIVLKKKRHVEEYIAALASIENEAHRLEILINSLLQLAQAGNVSGEQLIEPIRIDELLIQVKGYFNKVYPANRIRLDFSNLPEDQHNLVVNGSSSLLTVSITNIMDNACKFSNNQPVIVQLHHESSHIMITIIDSGIGIPENDLQTISEPLYRAENARGINGFGIGLTLAHKILRMHKGSLHVKSAINEGTTVTVKLPVSATSAD